MLFFIMQMMPKAAEFPNLNTSHVILYRYGGNNNGTANKFKYISCYSLSNQHLYNLYARLQFKYISCYSLSFLGLSVGRPVLGFKYISCYSLSNAFKPFFICNISLTPLFSSFLLYFTTLNPLFQFSH